MKYLIIVKQAGDGCDHSIGCGLRVKWQEANSPEEAFSKWVAGADMTRPNDPYMFNYHTTGEGELASVKIIPVPKVETNEHLWPAFVERRTMELQREANKDKDAKALAEYERLKKRFE